MEEAPYNDGRILMIHFKISTAVKVFLFFYFLPHRENFAIVVLITSEKGISCGVPQGSVLGPILFILSSWKLENVATFSIIFMQMTSSNIAFFS